MTDRGKFKQWGVYRRDESLHVIPLQDLRLHTGIDCDCHPALDGDVWVHHAYDGREARERPNG